MKTTIKKILLVDDHLGFTGSAKFFEWKLSRIRAEEKTWDIEVKGERYAKNMERRLKTEPFDLALLDIDFGKNVMGGEEDDLTSICGGCPDKDKKDKDGENVCPLEQRPKKIGECLMKYVIRPSFPGLPVIMFTSKKDDNRYVAATRFAASDNAAFFPKSRLKEEKRDNKDDGYHELWKIMAFLLKEYENGFRDKIEVDDTRREELLEARNRDYMQTHLWQALTGSIQETLSARASGCPPDDRFALAFFDLDGLKKLNDRYGYQGTNRIMKAFIAQIQEKIKNNFGSGSLEIGHDVNAPLPTLGRFFRERDEFLLCWEKIESKDKAINNIHKLIEDINDEKFQKAVFEEFEEKGDLPLRVTASFGLFVYPDDLRWDEREKYRGLKADDSPDILCEYADKVYRLITSQAQKLKDNAKALGKNQVCYYEGKEEDGSGYVNIRLRYNGKKDETGDKDQWIDNPEREKIRDLFVYVLGDAAFDFVEERTETAKDLPGQPRPIHLEVAVSKKDDSYQMDLSYGDAWRREDRGWDDKDRSGISLKVPIIEDDFHKTILRSKDEGRRNDALVAYDFMRQLLLATLEMLCEAARAQGREHYWPKNSLQRTLHGIMTKISGEVFVFGDLDTLSSGLDQIENPKKGVEIPSLDNFRVSERLSNKHAADNKDAAYRRSLVIKIAVVNKTAFPFLVMEAGRNMIKIQQYIEGYFKGFLQMRPDGEEINRWIDLRYKDKLVEKEKLRRESLILCRHEFFSPVDPIVYSEIIKIDRIRIDFDFGKIFEYLIGKGQVKGIAPVQHVPVNQALGCGILEKGAVVDKFRQTYFSENDSDLNLVVYGGSEMIGPSIQVAEIAGAIVKEMLGRKKQDSFLLFDIFSGSSATTLPSFQAVHEWVRGAENKRARILRLDDKRPGEGDCLAKWFHRMQDRTVKNDEKADSVAERLLFKDDCYIEAGFDFNRGVIVEDKDNIRKEYAFDTFLDERILRQCAPNESRDDGAAPPRFDVVIADPPHIFSIPFLFWRDSADKPSFAEAIAAKADCFIVYYAHKEQVSLCEAIRKGLAARFDYVWRVTVAGEEMAVCANAVKGMEGGGIKEVIEKVLEQARVTLRAYYQGRNILEFDMQHRDQKTS